MILPCKGEHVACMPAQLSNLNRWYQASINPFLLVAGCRLVCCFTAVLSHDRSDAGYTTLTHHTGEVVAHRDTIDGIFCWAPRFSLSFHLIIRLPCRLLFYPQFADFGTYRAEGPIVASRGHTYLEHCAVFHPALFAALACFCCRRALSLSLLRAMFDTAGKA